MNCKECDHKNLPVSNILRCPDYSVKTPCFEAPQLDKISPKGLAGPSGDKKRGSLSPIDWAQGAVRHTSRHLSEI